MSAYIVVVVNAVATIQAIDHPPKQSKTKQKDIAHLSNSKHGLEKWSEGCGCVVTP